MLSPCTFQHFRIPKCIFTASYSPSKDAALSMFCTSPSSFSGKCTSLLTRSLLSYSISFLISVCDTSIIFICECWRLGFSVAGMIFYAFLPLFYSLTSWNIFLWYSMNTSDSFKWLILLTSAYYNFSLEAGSFPFYFLLHSLNPLRTFLSPFYELSSLCCSSFYYLVKHLFDILSSFSFRTGM